MLTIKADPTLVKRALTQLEREQLPFAQVMAATRMAKRIKAGVLTVMRFRLDRPTSTTMNSLFVKPATKRNPQARVWFKDQWTTGVPADRYLQQAVLGGARTHKRFEQALIARGIMRRNEYAIPADWTLNAHGNVPRGLITKVLSGLGAAETASGFQANATRSQRSRRKGNAERYFVMHGLDGQAGIWERRGTKWGDAIRPVFLFSRGTPQYRVIFPFFKIADNMVRAHYPAELEAALSHAMATARP